MALGFHTRPNTYTPSNIPYVKMPYRPLPNDDATGPPMKKRHSGQTYSSQMHNSKRQHTNVLDTTQSKPHQRWGCSHGTRRGPIHTFQRKSTNESTLKRLAGTDGGAPRSLALCIATARCEGTCGIFNQPGQDIRPWERPMRNVSDLVCIEAAKPPAYPAAVAKTCWRQRPWCTASW